MTTFTQVFLERDIVRFSVPSLLVETSFDGRVFFCPESLAFFSVDYNDSEMLQSLLSKTDKLGYIGHLIGSHTPFMELSQETFEFAASLRRPFQMFELACHLPRRCKQSSETVREFVNCNPLLVLGDPECKRTSLHF